MKRRNFLLLPLAPLIGWVWPKNKATIQYSYNWNNAYPRAVTITFAKSFLKDQGIDLKDIKNFKFKTTDGHVCDLEIRDITNDWPTDTIVIDGILTTSQS